MPRPPDWSALGFDDDPTPGDPEGLADLIASHQELVTLASTMDEALTDLMNSAGSNFVGETADALREVMDKRLRKFIQTFHDAHQSAHDALETYRTVMVTEQANADNALTAAQGLEEDDPDRETHRGTAESAADALEDAARTAGDALYDAALAISSPIDECAEFWKFLTFFALALIAPALIFGGPVALLAIAVNAALLIHTAVEFANGNASVTELVLGILGVLIPTTRGINITKLLSTGWKGLSTTVTKLSAMTVDDMMRGIGKFSLAAVQFAGKGLSWAGKSLGDVLRLGANSLANAFRVGGIAGVASLVLSLPARIVVGTWNGVGKVGGLVYRGLGGANGLPGYVASNFKGFGPLALILPVNATEIGGRWSVTGLLSGLKLGVWNRGVLNQFRTGATFVDGVPIDVRAIRGFDGGVGISSVKFAKYQPAAYAGNQVLASIGHLIDPGLLRGGDLGAIGAGFSGPSITAPPPISVSFADNGLSIGLTDISGLGPRGTLADLPNFTAGGLVTPPPSVVVHMPGADGRVVAVELPVLPSTPGGVTGAGAHVQLDINFDAMTPIRIGYGDQGLTLTTVGGGRLPTVTVATMPQLGEVVAIPPGGLTLTHADLAPAASLTGNGVGDLAGKLPSSTTRLDPGTVAIDLKLSSAPPLRLHFADQGLTLSPPSVATPSGGVLGDVTVPSVHVPGGQSLDQGATVTPQLPETTVSMPSAGQLDVQVGTSPGFSVNLGEGFGHALGDFAAARLAVPPPTALTGGVTPPTPTANLAANVTPPPALSGAGRGGGEAAAFGDITLHLPDVAPVRLSSIEAHPGGATGDTAGSLPTPTGLVGESNIARGTEAVDGPGLVATGRAGTLPPGTLPEQVVVTPAATVPAPATALPTAPTATAPTAPHVTGPQGLGGGAHGGVNGGGAFDASGLSTLSVTAFAGVRLDVGLDATGAVKAAAATTPPGAAPITTTVENGLVHLRQSLGPNTSRHWTFEAGSEGTRPLTAERSVTLTGPGLDGVALRFDELSADAPPVLVRDGTTVDGATVGRFGDGHLVGTGDGRHVVVDTAGNVTHGATVLTRPGGRPDLVVLHTPDGRTNILPRTPDGTVVPDTTVHPEGNGKLRLQQPDATWSSHDGTTGRFERSGTANGGDHIIDASEFKLLDAAERPAFLKWLAERPAPQVPGLGIGLPGGAFPHLVTPEVRMMRGPEDAAYQVAGAGGGPGTTVRLQIDPDTRRVVGATADDGTFTVTHTADGTSDLVTVRQGAAVVSAERFTPLAGDGFDHLHIRVDTTDPAAVPALVRHAPDGSLNALAGAVTHLPSLGTFRVTAPGGAHVGVDATGAVTHRFVPHPGGAGTHLAVPVPGHPGGPALLDGAGVPVPGATVTVRPADQYIVVARDNLTTIHTPTGQLDLTGRPVHGGALRGEFLYLPPTGGTGVPRLGDRAGGTVAGSDVVPLSGDRFRVSSPGGHVVVDVNRRHLGDAVPLTGHGTTPGEFVHTPVARPHEPELLGPTGDPVAGAGVRRLPSGDLRVTRPGTGYAESFHTPGGVLRFERFALRGGSGLDGHRLVVPADATPARLEDMAGGTPPGAFVRQRLGGEYLVGHNGAIGQVDATGRATNLDLPLGGATAGETRGRLLRPAGVPPTPLTVLDGALTIPAADIRVTGGLIEVRRGPVTSVHTLDGALRNELREIRGVPGLDNASLHVPTGGGPVTAVDGARTPLGGATLHRLGDDSGFLFDTGGGWRGVLDDSGLYSHQTVPLRDAAGGDTGVIITRQLGGPGIGGVYRGDTGATVPGATVHAGEITVPTPHGTRVHGADGALLRETFTVRGGSALDGHTLTVRADNTATFHGPGGTAAPAIGQADGSFRLPTATGPHVVVGADGTFQHTAVPLTGRGGVTVHGYAHQLPGGSALRGADGTPLPGTLATGAGPDAFTVTRQVNHPGAHGGPPVTHDVVHTYGPGGALVSERITISGGAFDGRTLTVPADPRGATLTAPHQATLHPDVTPQANGGMRIGQGNRHVIVDATGLTTHRAVPLTRPVDAAGVPHPTTYAVFDQTTGALDNGVRAADGTAVAGATVRRLPDGDLVVTRTGTPVLERFAGATGAFRYEARALTETITPGAPQQYVTVHTMRYQGVDHRAYDLLDQNLAPVPGASVTGRSRPGAPDTGFRAVTPDGSIRLFDANGRLETHIGPPNAANHTIRPVTHVQGGATVTMQVIELSDGLGARFLRVDGAAPQLLDGGLGAAPHTGAITTPGGNYRVEAPLTRPDGTPSAHAGEYKLYNADGKLIEQRVNPVYRDQLVNNQYFKVTYTYNAQGAVSGTWERWRGGVQPPPVAPLNDRGIVDAKGIGHGQVTLTTARGGFVFESRPLPDGATLQAHTGGSVAPFVERKAGVPWGLTERERWQRVTPDGTPDGHGIRVWSPSRKTWMDYSDVVQPGRTWSGPVRHFRETPDGGHVLAERGPGARPLSYQIGDTATWHRYSPSGEHLASGDRRWNVFRNGWTDRVPDPRKGETVDVHVKYGRLGWHNLRNFRAHQMAPDGTPKPEWSKVSPQGKENAAGRFQANGEWIETQRIAEQRPANFYRWLMNPEVRHTNAGPGAWRDYLVPTPFRPGGRIHSMLGQHDVARYASTDGRMPWVLDNRYQSFAWRSGDQSGVQNVASRGISTTTFDRNGRLVAETRALTNGNTLTVGPDVTLPPGLTHQTLPNGYLPWTEGAGKLQGHRTFNNADFAAVPPPASSGRTAADVQWQDRFTTDLTDGNWFSPNAAKDWHVTRMGFNDGSVIEFRPRAADRAVAPGDGGLTFQRTIHADQGVFPGGGAAPGGYRGGDWVLMNNQGKIIKRLDTWPEAAPVPPPGGGAAAAHVPGSGEVRVVSEELGRGKVAWRIEGTGQRGTRKIAARNQFDHNNYFDRESYRDFDANGRLIREKRLLGDGTTVNAWRYSDTGGTETWHWNKVDRHGNVMAFGNQTDRVRVWLNGDTVLPRWEPGARFADRQLNAAPPPPPGGGAAAPAPPHVVVQELPKPVGSGLRQFFNDAPLRVREYAPTPADLPTRVFGTDAYRAWKEFESGAVARTMERAPDGSFFEVESMAKHWRRYFYDATGQASVITERTIPGFIWERGPAGSFVLTGPERYWGGYRPDFHLAGRETRFVGFLNEFRGYERELRQPRRTSWGPAIGGESSYTPFAVRNFQHMLIEMTQEFVLDFALNMAVYAALGPFSITDVQQAALAAVVSSAVKGTNIGLHNWAAHRSSYRVGLNWQDRGFPYRFRQDDDDWAGEWAFNEFVVRWRGGTYEFFKDGFVFGPLGAFLGQLAAIEVFGIKDSQGNRHDVSLAQAAALAGAAALGTIIGSATSGALRTAIVNTVGARWYHRQGVIDFVLIPAATKMLDKSLAGLLIGPNVREWLGITTTTANQDGADDSTSDAQGEPGT